MKISELCESERPRERMMSAGAASLGNAELLAILLRSGTHEESALDLAQRLLSLGEGRLSPLFNMPMSRFLRIPGIGPCKAVTVQAALELGRRFMAEASGIERKPIVSSRMIYDRMLPQLKSLDHEECWVLFLNSQNYLISTMQATTGGSTSTTFDIRQIMRSALERCASAIVLVHNHPTGNPRPSQADIRQTDALHKACSALNIDLLDHVVISDDSFFSFSDDRLYLK